MPETVIEALAAIAKEVKAASEKDSGRREDALWQQFAGMRNLPAGEAPIAAPAPGPAIIVP